MTGEAFREKIGFYMDGAWKKENYRIDPNTNEVFFQKIDIF